jgi:hypothetical protein
MESKAKPKGEINRMKNFKNPAWKEAVTKVVKQIQEQDIKFVRLLPTSTECLRT